MKIQGGNRNSIQTAQIPFASIITVVFNSQEFIERTIKSVSGQRCQDYEYIIIDGGSTDNTVKIIQQWTREIDCWISEPDKGIYDAMNKGLAMARGKYVWFINSGDEIESEGTLRQLTEIQNADIIYGETNLINATGIVLGTRSALSTRKLPLTLHWKDFRRGMLISHQSVLVSRAMAPTYNNSSYKYSADLEWVIESLKRSSKIVNSNLILSKYLVGGTSAVNLKQSLKERYRIFRTHFGLITTIFSHALILFRGLMYKVKGKSNY